MKYSHKEKLNGNFDIIKTIGKHTMCIATVGSESSADLIVSELNTTTTNDDIALVGALALKSIASK